MNKADLRIICTSFSNGKRHDFRLFAESGTHMRAETQALTDTGYLGIEKLHANSVQPRKSSKLHKLTREDKLYNHSVSSDRIANEHVIGSLKRFKIISDKYRNRRKRFGLRFNLICGIHNFELD